MQNYADIVCIPMGDNKGLRIVADAGETLEATLRAVALELEFLEVSVKRMSLNKVEDSWVATIEYAFLCW